MPCLIKARSCIASSLIPFFVGHIVIARLLTSLNAIQLDFSQQLHSSIHLGKQSMSKSCQWKKCVFQHHSSRALENVKAFLVFVLSSKHLTFLVSLSETILYELA